MTSWFCVFILIFLKVKNGEHEEAPDSSELRIWCEQQLSILPPINSAIDLPTISSVLCEMEKKSEVLEFIETSFGNSKRVNKFSKEFMQRRDLIFKSAAHVNW